MGPNDASQDVAAIPPGLEARARSAWLRGRLRLAAIAALQAALLPAVVLAFGHLGPETLACGAGFTLLAAALTFHGRAPGHAVVPGLFAAASATLCPLILRTVGHACSSAACMSLCLPACVVGGAAAGVLLTLRARHEGSANETLQTLAAGCLLVGVAAPMGCAVMGVTGMLAVTAGVLAGSAPVLVRARS